MAIQVVKATRFQLLGHVNEARRYADRARQRSTASATKMPRGNQLQNRISYGDRWHRNSQLDRHDVVI
jgi:hypothetical protein